jgi:hypothetical protein
VGCGRLRNALDESDNGAKTEERTDEPTKNEDYEW